MIKNKYYINSVENGVVTTLTKQVLSNNNCTIRIYAFTSYQSAEKRLFAHLEKREGQKRTFDALHKLHPHIDPIVQIERYYFISTKKYD